MGRPGLVTVLCDAQEEFALRRLQNELGIEFFDARRGGDERSAGAQTVHL